MSTLEHPINTCPRVILAREASVNSAIRCASRSTARGRRRHGPAITARYGGVGRLEGVSAALLAGIVIERMGGWTEGA